MGLWLISNVNGSHKEVGCGQSLFLNVRNRTKPGPAAQEDQDRQW